MDQRNVKLAERLLQLPSLLQPNDLKNGNYIFVNFGQAHTVGATYYLEHPMMQKIKSVVYSGTYGLLDNNDIIKFTPTSSGWAREILR